MRNGKVVIVDEFTGRMMEGRRYSDGLHQALEAKEKVPIQAENQTLASITFQNYFRLYPKLAGMTGTAATEASEFGEIYGLDVAEIPTHMPMIRDDEDDEVYRTANEKYKAIVASIAEAHERGQPMLVGTVSIEKSEHLSALLKKAKIPHQVLNARYHEQEAYIVAQAGRFGGVTIATNMAGRGTDIQLGGNPEMRKLQELAGIEDEAERAAAAARIEREVAAEKEKVIAAGGLYVLGTERHELRRIDNQLRGRSGRQGDPGRSKFYLSLEDDLMRIFGSERMDSMLGKLGLQEDEAIVHPWINKALEKAQQKVEARNFEIRKNLLKFDNVMNDQRKVIYEQRHELIEAKEVADTVHDMRHQVIDDLVARCIPEKAYAEQWDMETLAAREPPPARPRPAGRGMGEGGGHRRRRDQGAPDRRIRSQDGAEGGDLWPRADAHGREEPAAADPRSSVEGAPAQSRSSSPGHSPARLWPARPAERIQEGGVRPVRGHAHQSAPDGDAGDHASRGARRSPSRWPAEDAEAEPLAATGTDGRPAGPPRAPQAQRPVLAAAGSAPVGGHAAEGWGKVGRNTPCPCGSGKKYKHCHGRLH